MIGQPVRSLGTHRSNGLEGKQTSPMAWLERQNVGTECSLLHAPRRPSDTALRIGLSTMADMTVRRIALRPRRQPDGPSSHRRRHAYQAARSFKSQLPQFLVREWIEGIRRGPDLALQLPGTRFLACTGDGNDLRDRLLTARNNHFLAAFGLFDQPREIGLRLMYGVAH